MAPHYQKKAQPTASPDLLIQDLKGLPHLLRRLIWTCRSAF